LAKLPGEWGVPASFYGAALILVMMFMPYGTAGWVYMVHYRLMVRHTQSVPQLAFPH